MCRYVVLIFFTFFSLLLEGQERKIERSYYINLSWQDVEDQADLFKMSALFDRKVPLTSSEKNSLITVKIAGLFNKSSVCLDSLKIKLYKVLHLLCELGSVHLYDV